jgi:hypothetical protein
MAPTGAIEIALMQDAHDRDQLSLYEKRVDALLQIVARGETPIPLPEHRRAQEDLRGEAMADGRAYYDRWLGRLRDAFVDAGVLRPDEIEARLAALRRAATREERHR